MKKILTIAASLALAVGVGAGANVAAAPAAEAATSYQYVWGSTPGSCTQAAKSYIRNWSFGYRAALYTPCAYDAAKGRYWSKVTFYTS
ncbi:MULTISPECIES: hypothetical protein [unclassified Pseudoclavibacter]|uniref:hypothetical protein n=1 Tax=unclassified Pseudoclavibacter TaxID=2615177 RepID=UPI001BA46C7F|nr:hypothetical protein [Pseudoclavibacter sp. Marseille-Q4354]MBS3178798.1 hypothetical protein [Pseudoclavibacter sp. Marseille-Q4354]